MSSPKIEKYQSTSINPEPGGTNAIPAEDEPVTSSHFVEASEALASKFTSLRLIGAYGDTALYNAREVTDGSAEPVTVKVYCGFDPDGTNRALKLFELEALAAARLSHRNIVKANPPQEIYGVHFATSQRHTQAETLQHLLDRQGWLDLKVAIGMIHQVADALEYAHGLDVLHLRLHPETILIEADGTVLVTDFGLEGDNAQAWARSERSNYSPIHFISPEQATGSPLDSRSDLYSLGVIFYKMLTDRLPIDSEDPGAVRGRHVTQSPLSPHLYSSDIPLSISQVIDRLLEKDPAKRFQDIASFRVALNEAVTNLGVLAWTEDPDEANLLGDSPIDLFSLGGLPDDETATTVLDPASQVEAVPDDSANPRVPASVEPVFVREAWETPTIELILDKTEGNERDAFEFEPKPVQALPFQRDFQKDPLTSPLSADGVQGARNRQSRPFLALVVVLTLAVVIGILVLARADRSRGIFQTANPAVAKPELDPMALPSSPNEPAASPAPGKPTADDVKAGDSQPESGSGAPASQPVVASRKRIGVGGYSISHQRRQIRRRTWRANRYWPDYRYRNRR